MKMIYNNKDIRVLDILDDDFVNYKKHLWL